MYEWIIRIKIIRDTIREQIAQTQKASYNLHSKGLNLRRYIKENPTITFLATAPNLQEVWVPFSECGVLSILNLLLK